MLTTGVKPHRIELPSPHPGQIAVRNEAKRFNWLSAGRRWRKTTLVMAIAVEAVLKRKQIIWGAPVYDQVYTGWLETKRAAGGIFEFNTSRMEAKAPNGGSIIYRSLDNPDNVRSKTADGVVIDEAGAAQGEAWHEVLRPMLMDTGGWAWIIGTPDGLNWFHDGHEDARTLEDSASWQAPTYGVQIIDGQLLRVPHPLENPFIQLKEIISLYQTMPEESFRQEILAEFISDSGSVFRNVKECAVATEQGESLTYHVYHIGIDLARSKDFTVITVIDCTTGELVYFDRFNQVDYLFQIDRLRAICERFNPDVVTVEENSNEALVEMLRRITYRHKTDGAVNIPVRAFRTTNESKAGIIQNLALAFERKELKVLNDRQLLRELLAFSKERLPISGQVRYAAPTGQTDDCVMSLAFCWNTARLVIGTQSLTLQARVNQRLEEKGFTPDAAPTDSTLPYWEMTKNIQAEKLYKEESRPMRYGPGAAEDAFDREVDGVPEWFG
jgi:hypothetical protein